MRFLCKYKFIVFNLSTRIKYVYNIWMLGAVLKQSNDYLGATSLFLLPAGYITKELEYFSETEGTIFVESAELLYIEI